MNKLKSSLNTFKKKKKFHNKKSFIKISLPIILSEKYRSSTFTEFKITIYLLRGYNTSATFPWIIRVSLSRALLIFIKGFLRRVNSANDKLFQK